MPNQDRSLQDVTRVPVPGLPHPIAGVTEPNRLLERVTWQTLDVMDVGTDSPTHEFSTSGVTEQVEAFRRPETIDVIRATDTIDDELPDSFAGEDGHPEPAVGEHAAIQVNIIDDDAPTQEVPAYVDDSIRTTKIRAVKPQDASIPTDESLVLRTDEFTAIEDDDGLYPSATEPTVEAVTVDGPNDVDGLEEADELSADELDVDELDDELIDAGSPALEAEPADDQVLENTDLDATLVEGKGAPPPMPALGDGPRLGARRSAAPPPVPTGQHRAVAGQQRSARDSSPTSAPPLPTDARSAKVPPPGTATLVRGPGAPPPPKPEETPASMSKTDDDDLANLMNEVIAAEKTKRKDTVARPSIRRSQANWYQEIFDASYFQTLPNGFFRRTLREVDFVERALGLRPGSAIMDLGCGWGRHTVELCKRGYEMTGLDLSLPLLEKALAEAHRRNMQISFIHGDMRDLNIESQFDGLISMHTSFGYFDDVTNTRVMQGMLRALKPGGRLVLDMSNRDFVACNVPRQIWWEGDQLLFMEEVNFDAAHSRMNLKRTVVEETETPWEQYISIRLYSAHEMIAYLQSVGFRVLSVSGDIAYPGVYLGPNCRSLIVVAERPA